MNIAIISGSIRRNRGTPQVADWVMSTAKRIAPETEFTLLDLKELNLPFFDEPMPPQDAADTREVGPEVQRWLDGMATADGYIFVTPEYNHGLPASVKNAVDFIDYQIKRKPAAIVSHGSVGGARSNEQLRLILNSTLGALPIPESVTLRAAPATKPVFTDDHQLLEEHKRAQRPLESLITSIIWHANALKNAREV
jgi:NAD(P)H-dependent FMN reductase